MTFIGAGMETTATALTWTWKLLAEHPDVRARLHAELDGVLAGRIPTADDVDSLPWTKAVVAKSIRPQFSFTGGPDGPLPMHASNRAVDRDRGRTLRH